MTITVPNDPRLRSIAPGEWDEADLRAERDKLEKQLDRCQYERKVAATYERREMFADEEEAIDDELDVIHPLLSIPLVGDVFAPVPEDGLSCRVCGAVLRDRRRAAETMRLCDTHYDQLNASNAASGPRPLTETERDTP